MTIHRNLVKTLLQLARLKKIKPPKRLPKQIPAMHIEREYGSILKNSYLADLTALLRARLLPQLENFAAQASKIAKDAGEDDLGGIFDAIYEEYLRQWPRNRVGQIARQEGRRTAAYQAAQLNNQLRPALGADIVGAEPWLDKAIEEFTRENVSLIKSIPDNLLSDLEKELSREIADGSRFEDLVTIVEDKINVAKNRAELIARDQVSKFMGDLNRVRQQDLGIDKFEWNTLNDEVVRPEHAERQGKIYKWSDPPNGETPGEPVNCRCYATPILPEFDDTTE